MTRTSQCDEAVVAVGLSKTVVSGGGNLTTVFRQSILHGRPGHDSHHRPLRMRKVHSAVLPLGFGRADRRGGSGAG